MSPKLQVRHTAPPRVRGGCTEMFFLAQPTFPCMSGGGEGTAHRFKWAACLDDRHHTKLKADSHKPRRLSPAHFTLRLAQKVHPHPHPPARKTLQPKTRQGDGSLLSRYPGVVRSSWADVLIILFVPRWTRRGPSGTGLHLSELQGQKRSRFTLERTTA